MKLKINTVKVKKIYLEPYCDDKLIGPAEKLSYLISHYLGRDLINEKCYESIIHNLENSDIIQQNIFPIWEKIKIIAPTWEDLGNDDVDTVQLLNHTAYDSPLNLFAVELLTYGVSRFKNVNFTLKDFLFNNSIYIEIIYD